MGQVVVVSFLLARHPDYLPSEPSIIPVPVLPCAVQRDPGASVYAMQQFAAQSFVVVIVVL